MPSLTHWKTKQTPTMFVLDDPQRLENLPSAFFAAKKQIPPTNETSGRVVIKSIEEGGRIPWQKQTLSLIMNFGKQTQPYSFLPQS